MTTKTRPFDPAEFLDTPETVAAYLENAFAGSNAAEIADAIGVVARARGMSELAKTNRAFSREPLSSLVEGRKSLV